MASKEIQEVDTEQFRLKHAKRFQKQLGNELLNRTKSEVKTRSSSRQNSKEETDSNQENIELGQNNQIFREHTNLTLARTQSEK